MMGRAASRKGKAAPTTSDNSEAGLSAYHAKRDFKTTREPREGGTAGANAFVVQHHWATRDHYDFRIEMGGVMKSWAVTRGPSTDPADKRLAVRTEDHPIAYNEFEGTIPKGQYGGGTVMLWDRGTFEPLADDPAQELAKGKLAFNLHGERMRGRWALVRMKPRSAADAKRENWLLIKEKDEHVRPLGDFLEASQTSVVTGRTREEIETGNSAVWHSNRPDGKASAKDASLSAPKAAGKAGTPPPFVPPMLCATRETAPEGDDWRYEIKYDGYRLQACVDGAAVALYTREGLDWTKRFPTIATALAAMGLPRCAMDGEAVVFDARGITDFPKLVASLDTDKRGIDFVAFDILSKGRVDLRAKPWSVRRAALEGLLAAADGGTVRLAPVLDGDGADVFAKVIEGGAEGIVAKRAGSAYLSRRSGDWLKIKGERRIDAVVVGYLPSTKRPFASLALAIEDGDGKDRGLRFVGGAGSGLSHDELVRTKATLDALTQKAPPPGMKNRELAVKKIVWVKPKLMAELRFAGFTGDGQLRHARFLGWKADRKGAVPILPLNGDGGRTPGGVNSHKETPTPTLPLAGKGSAPPPPRLSNPQRMLIPQAGITKQVLAAYYAAVADRILPHLADRPVSFLRAPDGITGEQFFQRHALPGMKGGIGRVPDPGRGHGDYLQIMSAEGLATCAQFSVIELHGWGTRLPDLTKPDRVVFDLDPDEAVSFADVKRAAVEIRDLLAVIGLESWPLLSGGKGIHVIAPLDRSADVDTVGSFAEGVAKGFAKAAPDRFVSVMSKARRKGKIFIDYVRNRQTSSAIVPWSPRAHARGSAAVPVSWDELQTIKSADQFSIDTAMKRDDPWADTFFMRSQSIPAGVMDALKAMF